MRDHALARLGWRAHHSRSLDALGGDLVPARVIARDRGRVLAHDGETEFAAPISGRLEHAAPTAAELPATGDWVAVGAGGAVQAVLERRGLLRRAGQVLAANVDLVVVAHAWAEDPRDKRLPRFLALAGDAGAPAVVALTKSDLLRDVPEAVAAVCAAAGGAAAVLPVSAATGEGVEAVRALVPPGRTVALVGVSGSGKSTLVNTLLDEEVQRTGAVRERDRRGRHVTVRRELLAVPGGGALIDTPGLRLVPVRAEAAQAFGDVAELAERCRFTDCAHGSEPGCAVQEAIAAGELDPRRVRTWLRLEREAARSAAREQGRRRSGRSGRARDPYRSR